MNTSHLIFGDLLSNNYENKVFNAYDSCGILEVTPPSLVSLPFRPLKRITQLFANFRHASLGSILFK